MRPPAPATMCIALLTLFVALAGCGGGANKGSAADPVAAAVAARKTDDNLVDATGECVNLAGIGAPKLRRKICKTLPRLTSDLVSELRAATAILTAAQIKTIIDEPLESEIGRVCHQCRQEPSDARDELTSRG